MKGLGAQRRRGGGKRCCGSNSKVSRSVRARESRPQCASKEVEIGRNPTDRPRKGGIRAARMVFTQQEGAGASRVFVAKTDDVSDPTPRAPEQDSRGANHERTQSTSRYFKRFQSFRATLFPRWEFGPVTLRIVPKTDSVPVLPQAHRPAAPASLQSCRVP